MFKFILVYAPPSYEEVVLQFSRNDPAQIAQTIQTVPAAPTNNSNAGNNEPDNVRPPPYTIS